MLGSSWGRKKLYRTALQTAVMSTGVADLVKWLEGKDNPNMEPHEIKPIIPYLASAQDFEGTDGVERDVVDIYLFNVQFARTLGERYRFRSLYYWQPTIFSKNSLVPFERQLLLGDPTRQEFFDGAYKRIAAIARTNGIIDISRILNGRNKLDFIDPYHVNESANQIIADRMAADVAPLLAELASDKRPASVEPGKSHHLGSGASRARGDYWEGHMRPTLNSGIRWRSTTPDAMLICLVRKFRGRGQIWN